MAETWTFTGTELQNDKLRRVAELEGYEGNVLGLIEAASHDSVCQAICMEPGCDYTTELEPDQTDGPCELCDGQHVTSILVLAGIV